MDQHAVGNDGTGHPAVVPRLYSGSTAPAVVRARWAVVPPKTGHGGSLLPWLDPALPGMPNSKINLPNTNPKSLVAFSKLLKPRFGQKSRDATTIAPKTRDLKTRQEEKRNGGNTGIHGKRTRWGSIPPKELERGGTKTAAGPSPPAAKRRRSDEEDERVERMGMGEKATPPAPT